jgi:uroporphyrinogen decarboxylase
MATNGSLYRERFAETMARRQPDRPPMDLGATDMTGIEGGPRRLAPLLGAVATAGSDPDEAVLQALDIDIRHVGGVLNPPSVLERKVSDTEFISAWGIGYRHNGAHYEAVGRPLAGASLEDLDRYPWPDANAIPDDAFRVLGEQARNLFENTPYVICGRHPCFGVMELGCWMCGFEDFLYRMAGEPEFVCRFFDHVWRYQEALTRRYYQAVGRYLHFTTSGDDFGTQTGPFVSPAMFRDLVAPRLADRIHLTRQFTDAVFFHHTCGAVRPLIPTLIETGVAILNPIQPRVPGMEPGGLKRDFGARLAFYGGVDTQILLPRGSPEEVRAETLALVQTLGTNGGYILSAAHTLQEDVPLANIVAMYQAGRASVR